MSIKAVWPAQSDHVNIFRKGISGGDEDELTIKWKLQIRFEV